MDFRKPQSNIPCADAHENQADIERNVVEMPKNSLAKRAVTNFAVKATPSILAHVIGNTLGGGELSKVTSSICNTIKTVTCKDRIVMEEAIKAQVLIDANACDLFLRLLNDAIQVYVQSDCKDYSLVVEAVLHDPNATLKEKVQYALMLKQQQHDQWVQKVKVAANQVAKVVIVVGVKEIGNMIASQAPKILENQDKADKRDEDRKRLEAQKRAEAERHEKDLDADAKRRKDDFEREQARQQGNFARERERRKAEEEQREANFKREQVQKQAHFEREQARQQDNFAREQARRKADEEQRKANYERDEARKQADFAREQERKQADFAREQERKRLEAEQRAKAQNK